MLKLSENPAQDTAAELLSCFSADFYTVHALLPLLDRHSLDGVWIQTDEKDRTTAILTKPRRGYLRIAAKENADFEELCAFLNSFGNCLLQASSAILKALGILPQTKCSLMALETETAPTRTAAYVYDGFRPLYDLVVRTLPTPPDTFPVSVQENLYNEWLSRTARGVFNGFTRVTAAYTDEHILAATAFADVLGDFAYLREVACAPEYRRQGYASSCVRTLCRDLRGSVAHIFLSCAPNNELFYQKSGFQKCADLEMGFLTR